MLHDGAGVVFHLGSRDRAGLEVADPQRDLLLGIERVYRNGPSVTLEPANAAMQPLEVSAERVEVRGVVVGIVRLEL